MSLDFVGLTFDGIKADVEYFLRQEHSKGSILYSKASPYGQILSVLENMHQLSFLYLKNSLNQFDLGDANVRNKSIHYLPQGWEPVIEKEVDGPRSEPFDIDGHDTRFGSIQAARRAMRAVFLGSAPSNAGQSIKGIKAEGILLGCAQPGQTIGTFEDVLKRLHDRLTYLYSEFGGLVAVK